MQCIAIYVHCDMITSSYLTSHTDMVWICIPAQISCSIVGGRGSWWVIGSWG